MKKKNLLLAFLMMIGAGAFAQNIDYSLVPYRVGTKWGYADTKRDIKIAAKYDDAQWFSEGLAAVKVGEKWGYINRAGQMVIPAKYTVAKSFRKGYVPRVNKEGGDSVLFAGASSNATGYEQCITTKGVVLSKCPAINENSVVENRVPIATVQTEKTYSLPNNNGLFDKVVDDYKISSSTETFYIAQKNGMYGVFNSKFETILPFEYSSIKHIKSGINDYLQVQKNGLNGLYYANGTEDIATEYATLSLVQTGDYYDYVILKKDGKAYVRDLTNKDFIGQGYSDITYDENGGFVVTDANNNRGFYFLDSRQISPKYGDIRLSSRNGNYLQIKTSNGKVGYINTAGDEYFVE